MAKTPLNGTKTHPLTPHALDELASLRSRALPRQQFNPGVADRLLREDLVQCVRRTSPYKTHKGRQIDFLEITTAGLQRLEEVGR